MRRLVLVLTLGLLWTGGIAQAAGPKDYVKGAGEVSLATVASFSVNAMSDPAGGGPDGTMKLTAEVLGGTFEATAVVTCMRVVGSPGGGGLAVVGGDVIRQTGTVVLPNFDGLIFFLSDSGLPGGQGDRFFYVNAVDAPPEDGCPATGGLGDLLTSGDITIIDE